MPPDVQPQSKWTYPSVVILIVIFSLVSIITVAILFNDDTQAVTEVSQTTEIIDLKQEHSLQIQEMKESLLYSMANSYIIGYIEAKMDKENLLLDRIKRNTSMLDILVQKGSPVLTKDQMLVLTKYRMAQKQSKQFIH